jgi:hypothetical protein
MMTETPVEFATAGASAVALRGLAEASGVPLRDVVELAAKGELRTLFANGQTYYHRSAGAPPRSPRHALLELRRKRCGWTAP